MKDSAKSTSSEIDGVLVRHLWGQYHAALVRYFGRRGIGLEESEDLTQEVFERLSRPQALGRVERADGYLFVTAANIANDHFRRKNVRQANPARHHVETIQRSEEFTPERLLEGRQELEQIVAALNEMPERMRNIFVLARLENLPRAEIAARLGVSKRLVEQQITLATACLADQRRRVT